MKTYRWSAMACNIKGSTLNFFTKLTYTHIYILSIVAHISLIWIFPFFPTQDGPSHIHNLGILHDLLNGGKQWGDYFSYKLNATPNLGFILLTYPLLSIVGPITAEKVFLSFYIIVLAISVPILISTFSKQSPFLPIIKLVAIPIIFNFTLMMGFYSYVIAVPVFLLAISLAWIGKNWAVPLKFVIYNTLGALIFFLHLVPFVYYLLALAVFSITDHKSIKKSITAFGSLLVGILPLLVMFFIYISNGIPSHSLINFSYILSINRAVDLIYNLFAFSTIYFSPFQVLTASVLWFAFLVIIREGWQDFTKGKIRSEQKAMLLLSLILTIIYLLAPSSFCGGSLFNCRFPWVIFLLLLPILADFHTHSNNVVNFSIIVAAIFSLFCNAALFRLENQNLSTFVSGLNVGCSKGELIMLFKPKPKTWPIVDTILHAPSYYGISNGCVDVGNYEAITPYFPVEFKRKVTSVSLLQYMENDPHSIDFSKYPEIVEVIGWDLPPEMQAKLQKFYNISFSNEKLTLWKHL